MNEFSQIKKRYSLIYADPPWSYQNNGVNGSAEKHYSCMSIDAIKALPVETICEENAVLFMWASHPLLQEALDVIKAWGFDYKTTAFTWVKTTRNGKYHFGNGYYTRANTEICLLGTRGKTLPRLSHSVRQLVVEPIQEHSRKPERVRSDIVELFGDLPRIELFARNKTEGWDVWGNQTEKFSVISGGGTTAEWRKVITDFLAKMENKAS